MDAQTKREIEEMKRRMLAVESFVSQKKVQQISNPLDEASRRVIGDLESTTTTGAFVVLGEDTELTIASGVITVTGSYHTVDTEADAGTDDLDTISTTNIDNGTLLVIRPVTSTRTVVAKDGTGNLELAGDFSMDHSHDTLTLLKDGSIWRELSRSDNNT